MEGNDLIKIGIIAARMWKVGADVEIEFAPSNCAYRIRRVDETRERAYYVEDVVEFQQWRSPSVWLGYSEKLGVLVIHVPSKRDPNLVDNSRVYIVHTQKWQLFDTHTAAVAWLEGQGARLRKGGDWYTINEDGEPEIWYTLNKAVIPK